MIWRADPQGLWTALSDSFSSSFSSLSVYLIDSFWFGQKLWIFEQSVTRKPRETKVSFFSAGCVKAVYISAQFPKGLPALKVKLPVYYLRWTSLALCYWGFLLFLALFSLLFCCLLPVNVPIWNQLSLPLFRLGCIKKLCLFFVYFLYHLQFPITKVN